jgi:replicative DNA helicase
MENNFLTSLKRWNLENRHPAERLPSEDRSPPFALDIENSLLGTILIDENLACEAISRLNEDDFYNTGNRIIFKSIKEMIDKKIPTSGPSLTNYLKDHGNLLSAGGEPHIAELFDEVATSREIDHYIEVLEKKSLGRKIINVSAEMRQIAYTSETSQELSSKAESMLYDAIKNRSHGDIVKIDSIIPGEYEQCINRKPRQLSGIPCGFDKIDVLTCGFQPGDLIIIGGRPSNGKTSFSLSCILNMALARYKILYFTLESGKEALTRRVLGQVGQINLIKMKNGYMDGSERSRFHDAAQSGLELPIYIDDSYGLSAYDISAKVRFAIMQLEINVVFVDYLQLINKDIYGKHISTNDATARISRSLKEIAKEANVPVVALSQLHRGMKDKKKKVDSPRLDDLRDSGAIEQDADVVIFVHRPELYDTEDETLKNQAEIIIAKQRDGPIGMIPFVFKKDCAQFQQEGTW